MKEYTFTLTQDEADIVVRSLGKQPFEVVTAIIQKIQQQYLAQVDSEKPTEQPPEETSGTNE